MESYQFLLDIAVILLCTKLLGLVSRKFNMPQVVGALLAGLLLGPAFLGIIKDTEFIQNTAEIGVIILMFCAGMETDLKGLKKCGKASLIIALFGVLLPLGGGSLVAYIYSDASILQNIFIGIILTATSVSITVETLRELGKLKSKSGNAILGAAIIDDILGIMGLTLITSFADADVNIGVSILKILGFFAFTGIIAFLAYKLYNKIKARFVKGLQRYAIGVFVFCLVMSFCAEYFFDVADITGAFFAGLIIASTGRTTYLESKFDVLSYLFLSPVFFASIGLQVKLSNMTVNLIVFSVVLTLVAIITKIIGCGFGAKMCGYTNKQCIRIGVGMISRGEVALIVADKGAKLGLLNNELMGPVVIVVIATTIITPLLLQLVYRKKKEDAVSDNSDIEETAYKDLEELDKYRDENI